LLYDLASQGVTLFVTTHYMDEATHCHRLGFIYSGRMIAEGTPHQIRTECMSQRILEVTVDSRDVDGVLDALEADPEVAEAYLSGATLHAVVGEASTTCEPERGNGVTSASVAASGRADAEALAARLAGAGFSAVGVSPVEPTIEDVFVHLVAREREAESV
jgi:ABC-2 type transport system ATP-binding protein